MTNDKNYKYIEMTRSFPLNAADFKIGNAKNEDVQIIKQHKRIEDAIIAYFPHVKTIEEKLSKKDMDLVKEYEKCGFCLGEIAMLCREVSLQTAIGAYVFNNGGSLDLVSAELMGLQYKQKEVFDTPSEVKDIIRVDANGYFYASSMRTRQLNSMYSKEVNDDAKYEFVGSRVVSVNKKSLNGNKKGKSKKFVSTQKVLRKDLPFYSADKYNLNDSPTWENIFSKFSNFQNIEKEIVSSLQKYSVNPDVIKEMGINDFKDIIFKAFSKDKSEEAISVFMGSVNKRVSEVMNIEENKKIVEKYMLFYKRNKVSVEQKIDLAKTKGILLGDLSTHHIVHVSNAGEYIDYQRINSGDNLLLVSSFMHRLIHSSDTERDNAIFGFFPEKGKNDLMLSITPIFRTNYTGDREHENEKSVLGVKACQER